jgi:hypothetical protein
MSYTQGFDGSTASGIALGMAHKARQDAERARVAAAVEVANANYAARLETQEALRPAWVTDEMLPKWEAFTFMWNGYRGAASAPARKVEPKLTFKPETPAETRIHAAAAKRGWGNRPCADGEVHFIREGAKDVPVTRDALNRLPILADKIVRQLESS